MVISTTECQFAILFVTNTTVFTHYHNQEVVISIVPNTVKSVSQSIGKIAAPKHFWLVSQTSFFTTLTISLTCFLFYWITVPSLIVHKIFFKRSPCSFGISGTVLAFKEEVALCWNGSHRTLLTEQYFCERQNIFVFAFEIYSLDSFFLPCTLNLFPTNPESTIWVTKILQMICDYTGHPNLPNFNAMHQTLSLPFSLWRLGCSVTSSD